MSETDENPGIARRRRKRRNYLLLILAAGKATRFKSEQSKVLHRLAGLPLGEYVLRSALAAGPERRRR